MQWASRFPRRKSRAGGEILREKATELQPWAPYPWYQPAMAHFAMDNTKKVEQIIRHVSTFGPKMTQQLERETGLRLADFEH